MVRQLLNAVTTNVSAPSDATSPTSVPASGSGQVVHTSEFGRREAVFQVDVTDGGSPTGNILLQGRLNSDCSWTTINTYTASGAEVVARFPQMRAITNTMSNRTASAWIDFN